MRSPTAAGGVFVRDWVPTWPTSAAFALLILIAIAGLALWWRRAAVPPVQRPRLRLGVVALVAGLLGIYGAYYDAAWHLQWGRDTFWSPPHVLIYGGIALVLVVAVLALLALRPLGRTWGERMRQAPAVGWVAAIAVAQLAAAPFDEAWHRIFGRDVTAFSPPHLVLAVGFTIVFLAAGAVLLGLRPRGYRGLLLVLVAVSLAMVQMMVIEHELPVGPDHPVARRWSYFYPLLTVLAMAAYLTLAVRLVQHPWAATGAALLFMALRLPAIAILAATGFQALPALPPPLVLPALAIDLWWQRSRGRPPLTAALAGAAAALVYHLVAYPWARDVAGLPLLDPRVLLTWAPLGIALAAAIATLAWAFGGWLATEGAVGAGD